MPINSKEFGKIVRKYADEQGIKYSYLADHIHMSRQLFYSRLEDGRWKLDEALVIMKLLGIPTDVFM